MSWQWDDRFGTALGEFHVDSKDNIRTIVEPYLGHVWDHSNIETAPDNVKMITTRLGSLRGGQLLFTSDPDQNSLMYGAWWPWGNGQTISLRLAPHDMNLSNTELAELKGQFRDWFAL